jgi:hypothetical protein
VNELVPTGTVTLVLADVEASTRLWESQPEEMAAAVAHLDRTVCEIVAACGGGPGRVDGRSSWLQRQPPARRMDLPRREHCPTRRGRTCQELWCG